MLRKNINGLFYPILPTREYYSWDVFNADSCNDFLNGEYVGPNEKNKIDEFRELSDENRISLLTLLFIMYLIEVKKLIMDKNLINKD